jgi:predicted TIM-barrel fold metal-dependent hydrolase
MGPNPTADELDQVTQGPNDHLLIGRQRQLAVFRERQPIADPPDEVITWPMVSVDDHLLEPPDTFVGRLEKRFSDRAPRIVEGDDGLEYWQLENRRFRVSGGDGTISWPIEETTIGPVRYADYRPAIWDVHERVRDMDRCGIAASLCFPSTIFGFAGRRFTEFTDPALGRACVRAYNDWLAEAWCGPYPHRFIPSQLPQLSDIDDAVAEILRNAERGFRAVSFSENPEKLGLPSIHSGYWDPFLAACQETGTVVNLHVGSSSETVVPSTDSPFETMTVLFQMNSISAAGDWLFSGIPLKFPGIRIVFSEGGIGWVPAFLDRLDYTNGRYPENSDGRFSRSWSGELAAADILLRNFWFTAIDDPTAFSVVASYDDAQRKHFMTEVDYPHVDTTWPNVQRTLHHQLGALPRPVADEFAYGNACELYGIDKSVVANWVPRR